MPIAALQQATIDAIGSSSALPNPCSVVKELIENALDSGATSVSIEISSNTIDAIQVKDNGSGIPPRDRELACKWNYTSKIQTLEDLSNIGGASLGFRGQALACIAEASGSLSITTRVNDEQVASELNFDRHGGSLSMQRTFHPIGTTVRVRDFLKSLPVRRQSALKNCTKQITDIKKLLHAYAFSRFNVRFSFRALKSKSGVDWVYSPSPQPSINDAIIKISGAAVAANCTTISLSSSDDMEDMLEPGSSVGSNQTSNKLYRGCIQLSAVLPKQDADLAKLNHKGQYVSIDGRPMKTTIGVGKTIVKILKSRLQCLSNETAIKAVDPFLYISLSCPAGVYDVNVEPGKDDVQFADHQYILSLVEELSKQVYGEVSTRSEGGDQAYTAIDNQSGRRPVQNDDGTSFQTKSPNLCRAKSPVPSQEQSAISRLNFQREMPCTPPSGYLPAPRRSRVTQNPGRTFGGDNHSSSHRSVATNPWELAKLGARRRYPRDPHSNLLTPRREAGNSLSDCIASSSQEVFDETATPILRNSQMSPLLSSSIGAAAMKVKKGNCRSGGELSNVQSNNQSGSRLPRAVNWRELTVGTNTDELSEDGDIMQAIGDRFGALPEACPVPFSTGAGRPPVRSPPQFNIIKLPGSSQTSLDLGALKKSNSSASLSHRAEGQQRGGMSGVGNQIGDQSEIRLSQFPQPRVSVIGDGDQAPRMQVFKNGNSIVSSLGSNKPELETRLAPGNDAAASASLLDLCTTSAHGFRRNSNTKSCYAGATWPKVSQNHHSRFPLDAVSSQICQISAVVCAATEGLASSIHQLATTDYYVKTGEIFPAPFFHLDETHMIELKSKALQLAAEKHDLNLSGITTTFRPYAETQQA